MIEGHIGEGGWIYRGASIFIYELDRIRDDRAIRSHSRNHYISGRSHVKIEGSQAVPFSFVLRLIDGQAGGAVGMMDCEANVGGFGEAII